MIRATIDLHVVSKSDEGNYWLSTITQSHWRDEKKKRTWCKTDGELRDEMRETDYAVFILVEKSQSIESAISSRFGDFVKVEQVKSWPTKLKIEEEFTNA